MSTRFARKLGWNALGLAIFAVMVFPVFWMISTSFKTNDQINSLTPTWFPGHPTLQHFENAIHKPYFWTDVKNTVIVVLVAIAVAMVLAFLAAVALEKYRFTGRKAFLVLLIGVQMLPGIGLIIPLYVLLAHVPVLHINLVNHLSGLIVVYISAVLPFSVWTLRGFLMGIPKELEEAAMVDGSSRLGAFVRILLPLVAPGPRRHFGLRLHHELERVHLRASAAERPVEPDDHGLAVELHRLEQGDGLGRADGRLDADRDPGRRSSSCSSSARSRSA